jgi:hypothetical protein
MESFECYKEVMEFLKNYKIVGSMLSLIAMTALIIFRILGINMRSFQNIRIRCEIYEKIITEKDKILFNIYLKEYIGFSITAGMAKYIHSTKHYDVVPELKNAFPYIEYNPEEDKINLKKCSKKKRIFFVILGIILLLPLLFSIIVSSIGSISDMECFQIIIIGIAFATPAVFYFLIEAQNIKRAVKLVERLEEKMRDSDT